MNILIIAVLILSLVTAFCAGVECGRSWEREEHNFWEEILDGDFEGEDIEFD